MANVLHRITKQYLKSVNTPDYPKSDWIHNPIMPICGSRYWIVKGDLVRAMNHVEVDELKYSTESSVYLIAEKQLLTKVNGYDYDGNPNAIINPSMPTCNMKYTKVVDDQVVMMTKKEIGTVDLPGRKQKWIDKLKDEAFDTYPVETIAMFALLVSLDYFDDTDIDVVEMRDAVIEILDRNPRPE